jgi:hypothetical protein
MEDRYGSQFFRPEQRFGSARSKLGCWTPGDASAVMQIFEDPFDEHLDQFCALNRATVCLSDRDRLVSLLNAHREDLEYALWWCLSRLLFSGFGPRDVFPGRLCKRLIDDALTTPSCAPMSHLLDIVQRTDGRRWDATMEILTRLVNQTRGWTRWPEPAVCGEAAAHLEGLEPTWASAVAQLRVNSRAPDRRDAFRRAERWPLLTGKILRTLASLRGSMRLLYEYLDGVCELFCQRSAAHEVELYGPYELFVLEIVSLVTQLWYADPSDDLQPPKPIEQQHPDRRKRIQRARFRVFCQWEPGSDHVWATQVLPTLESCARHRP